MESKRGPHPPVQRPLILDVLPPGVAPRLDILSTGHKPARHAMRKRFNLLATVGLVVVVIGVVFMAWQPWTSSTPQLPQTVARQIDSFVPYFYDSTLPDQFVLDKHSINFTDGVLFFQIHNPSGNNIVVTEQSLPSSYAPGSLHGASQMVLAQGKGAVSSGDGRTIGTLVTDTKPQALVTLRAGDWVTAAIMKDLVRALHPARPH